MAMTQRNRIDATTRKRGRPSQGVRDSVLAATRALIQEQGITGLTTRAVADRANASEASIHYHFGSKEALVEAAILEALAPLRARGVESEEAEDLTAEERLLRTTTLLERVYNDLVPLLAAVQADQSLRQKIAPQLSADDLGPHRAIARIARVIGRDDTVGDPEALALLIVGACFLRSWNRHMSTHRQRDLPSLRRAIAVLAGER
jgi:AcrR family transcriptional regulator